MTDDTTRLAEIAERHEKATKGSILNRYDHGGARQMVEGSERDGFTPGRPDRKLVADYYHEEDREFYFAALDDIPYILAQLTALRERSLADAKLLREASELLSLHLCERVEWRISRCEECDQEHEQYEQIDHTSDCAVTRLRSAADLIEKGQADG